jgi:hypothetical protein
MIHSCSYFCDRPECIKAQRDELRSRLAQPEKGPVAWESFFKRYCPWLAQPEQESFSPEAISTTQAAWKMGYDAAKAEQPDQEPVALVIDGVLVKSELPEKYTGHLYTAPPQREWQRLTDKEREEATGWSVEHIEAKLKEKNT